MINGLQSFTDKEIDDAIQLFTDHAQHLVVAYSSQKRERRKEFPSEKRIRQDQEELLTAMNHILMEIDFVGLIAKASYIDVEKELAETQFNL